MATDSPGPEIAIDSPRAGPGGWLGRPAGRAATIAVIGLTIAAPWWLFADQLAYFKLFGDDFPYISEAKTWPTTVANLLTPHNTHVVPLFRLWTYALVATAGRLARMPAVFGVATYLGLVATMAGVGRLVGGESRRAATAIAAMAVLGVSTVMESVVTWYSAGQALWAGAAVVVTISLARGWSRSGDTWRAGLVAVGVVAATTIWSGGLVAGPAAAAYLWAAGGKGARRLALALLGVTAAVVAVELILVRNEVREPTIIWEAHPGLLPRPIQAVLHSTQATAEVLVFANLGLDVLTTPLQSVAIVLGLAWLWARSRGAWSRPSPLEAAGATIVILSYLLVYTFRGNLPFGSLRELGWYQAIPQVGLVLFGAGWWSRRALSPAEEKRGGRLTRRGAAGLLGLLALLCLMQAPRAERLLLAKAPPMAESEPLRFPVPWLQRLRARYLLAEVRDRQVRHLARLDLAEGVAARLSIGPASIRRALGRIVMPGLPDRQAQSDVVGLMSLPPDSPATDPNQVRDALDLLLLPEPDPRPPWLDPKDRWPPKR